ncbi:MAG: transcriptional regulator [Paenibacillaceae bacterium]|jgi:DNA-binding MarR family transcriptional regulator|nr:transcriptional regulator [Paenibacillaceae bacterium]
MNNPQANEAQGLGNSLGFVLGVAARRVSLLLMLKLKEFEISPEQWSVLYYIREQEGLIQKELAGRSGKDKPTVTRILDSLEDKGLIVRKPGEHDRRSFRIYATDKGKELVELTEPVERSMNEQLAQLLGAEDCSQLLFQLNRIIGYADRLLEKEQEAKA